MMSWLSYQIILVNEDCRSSLNVPWSNVLFYKNRFCLRLSLCVERFFEAETSLNLRIKFVWDFMGLIVPERNLKKLVLVVYNCNIFIIRKNVYARRKLRILKMARERYVYNSE